MSEHSHTMIYTLFSKATCILRRYGMIIGLVAVDLSCRFALGKMGTEGQYHFAWVMAVMAAAQLVLGAAEKQQEKQAAASEQAVAAQEQNNQQVAKEQGLLFAGMAQGGPQITPGSLYS